MNLYTDTSTVIKLYVQENNSDEAREWVERSAGVATGLLTRAEVSSGINRLFRTNFLNEDQYTQALSDFHSKWESYTRIPISEQIVARADFLICKFVLRGYDAIHLACALTWQEALHAPVILATFDSQLGAAAKNAGLAVLPE